MGGSESLCYHIPNNLTNAAVKLTCDSGLLNTHVQSHNGKKILQFGVINRNEIESNVCSLKGFKDPLNCT